jgi:hypothetical protein
VNAGDAGSGAGRPGARGLAPAAVRAQTRWMGTPPARGSRKVKTCPVEWCAGGHRCTAPRGEHRSDPQTWRTPYGSLVLTRIRGAAGADYVEMRAVARLPGDEKVAAEMARALAAGVDVTIRDVLRGSATRVRAAYLRLTGRPAAG